MNNQQVAPLELNPAKSNVFYKQFAPNGAVLVSSGRTLGA